MFFTIQSFTYFFWTLGGIILLMLIFEDKLLALEAKYDKKREAKKRAAVKAQHKPNIKKAGTQSSKRNTGNQRINNTYRRPNNFNAA